MVHTVGIVSFLRFVMLVVPFKICIFYYMKNLDAELTESAFVMNLSLNK